MIIQIYEKYSMPVIFVHTQTYSIGQSQTCKKGTKKYLKEIYTNETDVKSHLKNYINILARKDNKGNEEEDDDTIQDCSNNNMEPFGLDDLEKLSRKEIQTKGFNSSYYEYIKEDIKPIIINGAFRLFFTEKKLSNLTITVTNNIEKYLNEISDLINDEEFNLPNEIKNENNKILYILYEHFLKVKEDIKKECFKYLEINNLKNKYDKIIENYYGNKSSKYKKEMCYESFYKKVEDLMYNNLNKKSDEIINMLINLSFNFYVIENIKSGIEEQFSGIEEKIINKIYQKLIDNIESNKHY